MLVLKNDRLTLALQQRGAEMTSLRRAGDEDGEVLWQAGPAFWSRHAPVLFPIVGAVADGHYRHNGRRYPMGQHGFARDGLFCVEQQDDTSVTFLLTDSPATRQLYPFAFALRIRYRLVGAVVGVQYRVDNPGGQDLLFSIGAHPGFRCPLGAEDAYEDCTIEFDESEALDSLRLGKDGLVAARTVPVLQGERVLRLGQDTFLGGALIFERVRSQGVTLRGGKSGRAVRVSFPGFPFLGIWAVPGAPFVCIEPWFGINDYEGFSGEFAEKKGVLRLPPGGVFDCAYSIEVPA